MQTHETASIDNRCTADYTAAQKTLLIVLSSLVKHLKPLKFLKAMFFKSTKKHGNVHVILPVENSESNPNGPCRQVNTQFTWVATVRFIQQTFKVGTGTDEEYIVGDC